MRARRTTLLLACAALAHASGCAGDPTELVVIVLSNLESPEEIDAVRLVVTGPTAVSTSTIQAVGGADDPAFPLTLSVTPEGETLGPVRIAAIGSLGDVEVVRDEARTSLIPGESRMLRLFLLRGCIDRPCGADETCGENGCHPIEVAGDALAPFPGEVPPWTADDACQNDPWDQDDDGQGAAACGGLDCDDQEPLTYDGAPESCDGIDNDCDATTDEDCDCEMGTLGECTTVCGSAGSRSCRDDGTWGACSAPEVCNGVDDDCDGSSDEGFTYGADAPAQVTSANLRSRTPFLSYENGRFAMVWTRSEGEYNAYYGTLAPDRSLTAAPVQVGQDAIDPRITWNGSQYAVTWWDSDTCGSGCITRRVYYTTVDETGMSLSRVVQLESSADDRPNPRVVWNGTQFAASYADGELYLQLMDAAGAVAGERILIEGRQGPADLLFADGAYTLLFTRDREVFYNRGTEAAFLSPSRVVHEAGSDVEYPALAAIPGGYFAAWSADSGRQPEVAVLDREGVPTSGIISVGDPSTGINTDVRTQLAATEGQVFVVVRLRTSFRDGNIFMMRFAPDGTVLQDSTPIIDGPSDQAEPSIAWDGERLGVAYTDDQTGADEIWFASVGCE